MVVLSLYHHMAKKGCYESPKSAPLLFTFMYVTFTSCSLLFRTYTYLILLDKDRYPYLPVLSLRQLEKGRKRSKDENKV